jgi:hypothetical protein
MAKQLRPTPALASTPRLFGGSLKRYHAFDRIIIRQGMLRRPVSMSAGPWRRLLLPPKRLAVRTLLLPSGNLLVPVEPDDPTDGFGLRETSPEHPEYGRYLAFAEAGEDPRPREEHTW